MVRIAYFDFLKFMAIFLVVAGHCIQRSYMSYDLTTDAFYYDGVFKFIYGFHLPLFMVISGYFFYETIRKYRFCEVVKSRFTRLLIPIVSWHIIWLLIDGFSNHVSDNTIISLVRGFLSHYWFLWAIFYCSLGVLFIKKVFNDSLKVYFLILPLTLFLPNVLNIERYVYLFPYFLFGYIFCTPKLSAFIRDPFSLISKKTIILGGALFIIIYVVLSNNYRYDYYIYTSGTCVIKDAFFSIGQLYIDLYRYLAGFVGVIGFCCLSLLFKDIKIPAFLIKIGAKTLGIYIIHMFFTPIISEFQIGINYFFILFEVIALIVIPFFITIVIEKNKILSLFLLGKKFPPKEYN